MGFLLAILVTGRKAEMMLEIKAAPSKAKTTRIFGLMRSKGSPVDLMTELLTRREIAKTETVDKMKLTKAMMKASE